MPRERDEAMEATQMLRVMQQELDQQQLEALRQQQVQMQPQQPAQAQVQPQQAQQPQGALPTATARMEKQFRHQRLMMRGFDNIETLSGDEDLWQIWSWKIKTAVSGMNGGLVEILEAAETDGVRNLDQTLKEDTFVDANQENCVKASKEMYSVLARYTNL